MNASPEATQNALSTAFTWMYNSLADYIVKAHPYVAPGDDALLAAIHEIAAGDARLADAVAGVIERREGIVTAPPYEVMVTEWNYLSVRYLATVLGELSAKRGETCTTLLGAVDDDAQSVIRAVRDHLLQTAATLADRLQPPPA